MIDDRMYNDKSRLGKSVLRGEEERVKKEDNIEFISRINKIQAINGVGSVGGVSSRSKICYSAHY